MNTTKKIKIKDLTPGMKIKTTNESGNIIFKTVSDVWETKVVAEDQVRLEFVNGTVLNCSVNHPIMVLENGKIVQKMPAELTYSDTVITDASVSTQLSNIQIGGNNPTSYIDITVEDTHTFFAQDDIKSDMVLTHNSQGSVRGGSATIFYPIWHLEVEDLLVLKNNKGIENNRVRYMDYGVQFNKLFYQRLIEGKDITLFSPHDVPELYEAFFVDNERFAQLYEQAEKSRTIRKKTVSALQLFSSFMQERKDTGRIYLMNVDHCNTHGPLDSSVAPIRQSNLCVEITNTTTPLKSVDDPNGEIALCTLSAVNFGKIKEPADFESVCELAVRGLDAILDYQTYPILAAELATHNRRPIGIGIVNFAYWMAKQDMTYSNPDLKLIDQYVEAWSYYIIKASVELAKERGSCPKSDQTKYSKGIFPIDTYAAAVDQLVEPEFRMPWDQLKKDAIKYGIRNSTLMALMPSECQSLNNQMLLKDGTTVSLEHIIQDLGGINIDQVHQKEMIGQRFAFNAPVQLFDSTAYECYYNGPESMTEIEMEDGNVYRFTPNHKLKVVRNNKPMWVEVCDLQEDDDVCL